MLENTPVSKVLAPHATLIYRHAVTSAMLNELRRSNHHNQVSGRSKSRELLDMKIKPPYPPTERIFNQCACHDPTSDMGTPHQLSMWAVECEIITTTVRFNLTINLPNAAKSRYVLSNG
jgi:hypothetical protein